MIERSLLKTRKKQTLLFLWSWKKDPLGSYSLSCFQAHEKEVHRTSTRSHISRLVKKRPVGVLIRFLVFRLMKKRSTGPQLALTFQSSWKKEVHRTSTRSLISRLMKKRPVGVLIRFLVFRLMKKRSTGPQLALSFQGSWKKTRWGLFFNLRLRKASKPLRERVW